MKYKLLEILKREKDYISGESISTTFNLSRTAIWKHMNSLREDGYIIESKPNKGYKLISSPDLLNENEIQKNLKTLFVGKKILYKKKIDSTNKEGKLIGGEGSFTNGTIILAEEQRIGRGRFNRAWTSPKGGLWLSILLKPKLSPNDAYRITQIASSSIIETLEKYNLKGKIKWPNDIYLNRKKVAGILTEMKCDMDEINYLVVGIGINLNIPSFNEDTKNIATSTLLEKGEAINRNEFLGELLNIFEENYLNYEKNHDLNKVIFINRNNSYIPKKEATLITIQGTEKVICKEVNENGDLVIIGEDGKERTLLSGEISFK